MALISTIMDELVALVEAVSPDSVYDRSAAFRHYAQGFDQAALVALQQPTRRFILDHAPAHDPVGPMGAQSSPIHVREGFVIDIAYRMGTEAFDFKKVVGEDAHRLLWALRKPGDWTDLVNVLDPDWDIDEDDAAGGTAVMTISFTIEYLPDFAG